LCPKKGGIYMTRDLSKNNMQNEITMRGCRRDAEGMQKGYAECE
jgi:hypothetical protein